MTGNGKEQATIRSLAELLDDEDENVALEAMYELLRRGDAVEEVLAEYQESSNALVRKRVHQLMSALTVRRRRKDFLHFLENRELDFIGGAIEVHLQWYDNDNTVELRELAEKFYASLDNYVCGSLEDAAYIFRRLDFLAEKESINSADNYCLGPVLDDRAGAGSMAAGLICELGRRNGKDWQVARQRGVFGVYDSGRGVFLRADRNFAVLPAGREIEIVPLKDLIKYFSGMLFSHSVVSDNFRYVHTIGQALSGTGDGFPMDFLPYPYSPAYEDDDKEEYD